MYAIRSYYVYVMTTSFISYAFSNSIGLSILASSSLRYRYYSYYGLTFGEITKIILFTTMTLWAGILSVGGFAFCFGPGVTLPGNLFGYVSTRYIGAVFLAAVFLYLVILALRHNKPIGFYGRVLELPKLSIGVLQILVGGADWILAGTVLYVLLPDQVHIAFLSFIGIYLMAQTIGLMSHVPGGAVRITSYNVCYTKLLRKIMEIRSETSGLQDLYMRHTGQDRP